MLIKEKFRKQLSYVMLPVMLVYTVMPSMAYGNENTEVQANAYNSDAGNPNNYDEAKAAAEALNKEAAKSAAQSSKEKEENPASNSAASNYTMGIGAEVNVQTGQLDITFNDIKLNGISEDVGIDLGISNSGSESKIYGMPSGWKFSLDYIDIRSETLYMNGSQNYTMDKAYISKDGYKSGLRYCTSKAIKLEEEAGSLPYKNKEGELTAYRYKLSMKNGSSKYFDYNGKLLCQDDRFGNHIMYNYDKKGATPYNAILRSITDSFGQEIRIKSEDKVVTVTMPDERTVIYDVSDVKEIKIKGVTDLTAYLILDDKKRVKSIKYPTGGTVEYFYSDKALQYQVDGKAIDLPGVVKVVQDPHSTESKKAVTRYNYGAPGSFNFTGIGRYNYIPGDDILMKEGNNNYKYSTTVTSERSADCGGNVISTQEFNFLHLPLKTKITADGKCVGETTVNYLGEISNGKFPSSNRLPSNYNMPKKVTAKTFGKGNSRERIEETVYDDYNRPLSVINYNNGQPASKIETKYSEYYDLVESQSVYDYLDKEQGKDTPVTTITKTINTLDATTHKYIASSETFFANDKTRKKIATRTADNQGRITATGLRMTGGLVKNDSATSSSASTSYSLDSDGYSLTVKDTDALGNAVSKIIDIRNGNLISATDARGNTVSYKYENKGLWVRTTYPDGSWEITDSRNPNKTVTSYSNGLIKTSVLDGFGRVIKESDNFGMKNEIVYNELGKVAVETDEYGHSIKYTYDYQERETSATDSLGNVKETVYNDADLIATESRNGVRAIVSQLDDNGNIKSQTDFLSNSDSVTRSTYNGKNMELTSSLAIKGQKEGLISSRSTYDFDGNLIKSEISTPDGTSGTSVYKLNLFGDEISSAIEFAGVSEGVERGTGIVKSELKEYDKAGNLISLTNQAGQIITYTYDANGNIKTMRDFAGKLFEYTYDEMDRMVKMNSIVNKDQGPEYTLIDEYYKAGIEGKEGKLSSKQLFKNDKLVDKIDYDYDVQGRLTKVIYPEDGKSMSLKYDDHDRVIEMTDFAGVMNKYKYSDTVPDNIIEVSNDFGNASYSYYNRQDNVLCGEGKIVSKVIYSNRVGISFNYKFSDDKNPILLSIESRDSSGSLISGSYYEYDDQDRVSTLYQKSETSPNNMNSNNTKCFSYNLMNQLVKEEVKDKAGGIINSTSYTFDIRGNIINKEIKDANGELIESNKYQYNSINQLIKSTDVAGVETIYTYDYNGNMTDIDMGNVNLKHFTYNSLNQLVEYQDNKGVVCYEYNAERLRKCKYFKDDDEGRKIKYYYFNAEVVNEADSQSGMTSYLVAGGRVLRAQGNINEPVESWNVEWYIMSGKDVVSTINDDDETTIYNYNAYGEGTNLNNRGDVVSCKHTFDIKNNPYKYSGYYLDEESGMYYLQARYYSPELMRFISRDTYDLSNRYAYGDGNPISYTDRNGHSAVLTGINFALGIVGTTLGFIFAPWTGGASGALALSLAATTLGGLSLVADGVAQATEGDTKKALKWASFGMSMMSLAAGVTGAVRQTAWLKNPDRIRPITTVKELEKTTAVNASKVKTPRPSIDIAASTRGLNGEAQLIIDDFHQVKTDFIYHASERSNISKSIAKGNKAYHHLTDEANTLSRKYNMGTFAKHGYSQEFYNEASAAFHNFQQKSSTFIKSFYKPNQWAQLKKSAVYSSLTSSIE